MDKTKTISAIILVAGIGKRISKYTIKPKCLLKIKGESLLSRNIKFLKNIGIKNILVVAGFKSNLVVKEIKKNKNKSFVNVILNKKLRQKGFKVFAVDPFIRKSEISFETYNYKNVMNKSNNIIISVDHDLFKDYDLDNKKIIYAEI